MLFLLVSGMLEKICVFFILSQVCLKRNVFLRVSGMLDKKCFFCVCQVCLRSIFYACKRYA